MDPRGGSTSKPSHVQRRTSSPTNAEAARADFLPTVPARRGATPASGGRGGGRGVATRCALVPLMLFVVLTASVLSLYFNAVSFSKRAGASHTASGRVADEGEPPVLRQRNGQGAGGYGDPDEMGATIEALRRENEELRRALHRDRDVRVNGTAAFRLNVHNDDDGHICYPLLGTSTADDGMIMVPSAAALWRRYLPKVFNASQHPRDPKNEFHDWTAMLLRYLTPQRLLRSVKSLPDMELFGRRVLAVLQRRRRYLAAKAKADADAANGKSTVAAAEPPEEAPPLKILVLGGSVTAGVLCRVNALNAKVGRYGRKGCAWPFRLQHFANRLLGFDAVRVESVAVGGTFTEQGGLMYQYGLLPEEARDPDVVVNSYSSNDMHVLSVRASEAKNVTLERAVFDMTQDFIRAVSRPGCDGGNEASPPLLVYLDDYVGNEQHEVLRTMAFDRVMTELANYYGIMAFSYGDVVRDLVYGDVEENWFSPTWHEGDGTKKFIRQVHHGMGGHASIVWVLAFNVLNAATVYCSELGKSFMDDVDVHGGVESAVKGLGKNDSENPMKRRNAYRSGHGLPELHEPERFLPGEPRTRPRGLPPPLTENLTLQNVSQLWASSSEADEAACRVTATAASPHASAGGAAAVRNGATATGSDGGPCVFAWIGNLRGMDTKELLASKMDEVVLSDRNRGWEAELDNNKVGFVATGGAGSTIALRASRIARPVQLVHLLVMKSYGEKWANSRARVSIFVSKPQPHQLVQNEETRTPNHGARSGDDGILTNTEEITGFHASNISVTYTYQIDLKENAAPIGSNLTMVIDLIEGTTFKFTGMAICGR